MDGFKPTFDGGRIRHTTVACTLMFLVLLQNCRPGHSQNQFPPKFTSQPDSDIYYVTDSKPDILLLCQATGTPPLNFWWTRSDGNVTQRLPTDDGNLLVNRRNVGEYTCYVSNAFGTAVSQTVQVKLAYLHHFDDQDTPEMYNINAGSSFVLLCNPSPGVPTPLVFWYKDDNTGVFPNSINTTIVEWEPVQRLAQDEAGNLVFLNALSGRKTYWCSARSAPFSDFYLSVKKIVIVPEGPEEQLPPLILRSSISIQALRGEDVKLYCIATGNPTPKVTWTKRDDNTFQFEGPILVFINVQLKDAGSYVCTAAVPGVAEQQESKELIVNAAPSWKVTPIDTTVSLDATAHIMCEASGLPTPQIQWMENGVLKSDYDMQTSITVESTTLADVKVYQCIASNIYGRIIANAYVNLYDIGITDGSKPIKEGQGNSASRCDVSWLVSLSAVFLHAVYSRFCQEVERG